MSIIQDGSGFAGGVAVDATPRALRALLYGPDGNPIVRQHGGARAATDWAMPIMGANDDFYRIARMDRMGNQGVALNNVLLSEPFEGNTVSSPNRLSTVTTTFSPALSAAGGYNMNSTLITTINAASIVYSNKQFPKYQRAPLQCKIRARAAHVSNAVIEFGFGNTVSQTTSPTIGAYFQITASGVVQGVLTFTGVDTTVPITMPVGYQSNFYVWDIILDDDEALFIVQDTSTGLIVAEKRIQLGLAAVRLFNASHIAVFGRLHFPTAPATAATLIISSLDVVMLDTMTNKPWGQVMAGSGYGGEANPSTFAQTANYVNSTIPTSATLSNTAAGYTTLGGQFQFAAVAGAETDYALFGFTVPAPYSFFMTGVDIDAFNMGAAVATSPSTLQWFASPDQTAISLATATNRRITLGVQSLAVGAAIGTPADKAISRDFSAAPLVTNYSRILVIGFKMPVGTATASQIIRGTVAVRGYFE